jgi:glutaminyl-tRNA synthetase
VEWLEAVNNPEDPAAGTRRLPLHPQLWIERDDFREDPPKKYFRLAPGKRGAPALRLLASPART